MGMDADLSQAPEDFLKMREKILAEDDMVIGSRYIKGGEQIGKNLIKNLGSRCMNSIATLTLGIKLKDFTHTFRAFKRTMFKALDAELNERGHPAFQVQFTFWALRKGFKVSEIPIQFVEREANRGASKLSVKVEVTRYIKIISKLLMIRIKNCI